MATQSAQPQGQTVDLASLSAQQLSSVKKQLDDELEHLTTSFAKLRAAQGKFRECLNCVGSIARHGKRKIESVKAEGNGEEGSKDGKKILVPLTTSLYVPGVLADTDRVIVDVGTGFYVEKTTKDATEFYRSKIEDLDGNLKDLERIVQSKSGNLRVVEDVLRQKVISGNGGSNATASAA